MKGSERAAAHQAHKARLAVERHTLLAKKSDLLKAQATLKGPQAGSAGSGSRQARDELVAKLQEGQAGSTARLEALKQERQKRDVPASLAKLSAPHSATPATLITDSAQPLPASRAVPRQPSSDEVNQPAIRARRPTKPAAQFSPTSRLPEDVQLPFVEQDDDFETFAKSLQRYHSDREEAFGSGPLPGQILPYPPQSQPPPPFPWDPGSPNRSAMQQNLYNTQAPNFGLTQQQPPRFLRDPNLGRAERQNQPGYSAEQYHAMQPGAEPWSQQQQAGLQQTSGLGFLNQQSPQGRQQWGYNQGSEARLGTQPLASQLKALGDLLSQQAAGMQQTQVGSATTSQGFAAPSRGLAAPPQGLAGPSRQASAMPAVSRRPSVAPNAFAAPQTELSPQEEELRRLQEAHTRQMTKLKYELERVRTEAELAEMQDKIRRLQADAAAPLRTATPTALPYAQEAPLQPFMQPFLQPPSAPQQPQRAPVQQQAPRPEYYPEDPPYQQPVAPPRRQPRPVEPDSEEEQEVQERRRRYRRRQSSSSEDSVESSVQSKPRQKRKDKQKQKSTRAQPEPSESSQSSEADPVRIADVETYKVKDLWLELDMMSPVDQPGSYSIAVVLYDNLEPVQAAGNNVVKVQSNYKVLLFLNVITEQPAHDWRA